MEGKKELNGGHTIMRPLLICFGQKRILLIEMFVLEVAPKSFYLPPQCLQLRKSTWAVEIRSWVFFFYLMFVPQRRKLCLILTQRRRHNNNKIRFHTLLKPHNGLLQSETMAWAGVSNVRATRNGIPGGQSVFQLQSDFKWGRSCLMNNILHSFAFIVH